MPDSLSPTSFGFPAIHFTRGCSYLAPRLARTLTTTTVMTPARSRAPHTPPTTPPTMAPTLLLLLLLPLVSESTSAGGGAAWVRAGAVALFPSEEVRRTANGTTVKLRPGGGATRQVSYGHSRTGGRLVIAEATQVQERVQTSNGETKPQQLLVTQMPPCCRHIRCHIYMPHVCPASSKSAMLKPAMPRK